VRNKLELEMEKRKNNDHFKEAGLCSRIILKWYLKKRDVA
jgi:hypothetical protein